MRLVSLTIAHNQREGGGAEYETTSDHTYCKKKAASSDSPHAP